MSLDAFRKALDDLTETSYCEGSCRVAERIAIALPDGDVGAVDDPKFVDWLLAHAETAPFGKGGKTKVDAKVRDARRLAARGAASVAGFDPSAILDEIEATLSPREHLEAKLTDVLVYEKGGHFARHKDTPRDADLVGTLVVGLPVAHQGGAFHIDDGTEHVVDWSSKKPSPTAVPWVAMFSDVDHEIKPVTSGSRVTLVYSLSRSGRRRADAASDKALALASRLASGLAVPSSGPLMIACSRQVITEDETQPQGIDVLRGTDRAIADLLVEQGFDVKVRSCVTASFAYGMDGQRRQPARKITSQDVFSISRLSKPLDDKLIASLDNLVTFSELDAGDQKNGYQTLAPYILDATSMERWMIRKSAAATLIHESGDFSEDGNFGNEGYEAHIYTLAALEVSRVKAKKKPAVSAKAALDQAMGAVAPAKTKATASPPKATATPKKSAMKAATKPATKPAKKSTAVKAATKPATKAAATKKMRKRRGAD